MRNSVAGKRTKNVFDPTSKEPFRLSRSKIEDFVRCPLCFYLDRRLGVSQPPSLPFTLNIAVDHLLKKEFDIHRAGKTAHPLMKQYGIAAVPFQHNDIEKWRDWKAGIQYLHKATNFIITGAIDDVWADDKGQLFVVDYKATSTQNSISLDDEYRQSIKREVEVYQWLLRKNGFKLSDMAYFVFVNGRKDRKAFDGRLEFDVEVIPYKGSDRWVEDALKDARACLEGNVPPDASSVCAYCAYRSAANELLRFAVFGER